VDSLFAWAKQYEDRSVPDWDRRNMQDYNRMIDELKSVQRSQQEYVAYIRKASDLGCESAQKFISDYDSKNK